MAVREVIKEYEQLSGQQVNFDKSLIYFSNNVNKEDKVRLGSVLGVRVANNPEKYLRLPTMVGRRKRDAFLGIKERFLARTKSWGTWNLSIRGKEIFIKAILQSFPTYVM